MRCRTVAVMRGAARIDVTLGLGLTVLGLAEAVLGLTGVREPWYVVATVPVATLPIVVRRPRTALALGALLVAMVAQTLLGSDLPGGFTEGVALALVVFSAGRSGLRRGGALLAAALAGVALVIALGDDPHPANFVYMATVVAAAWAAGLVLQMAEERSELLAESRAQQERTRIAGRAARRGVAQRLRDRGAGRCRAARPAHRQRGGADTGRHRGARPPDLDRAPATARRAACRI